MHLSDTSFSRGLSNNAPAYRNLNWQAVAGVFTFCGALFGTWASRIPAFKSEFALDAAGLGILLLALAAGAIASFPLAGALSDRLGARWVTWAAALMYGPALVLLGFASDLSGLAIGLFLFGFLHGAMDVAMNVWGSNVEATLRRPVMSGFHAFFSLGAGIGAGLGGLAANMKLDPSTHLFIAAIIFAVPSLIMLVRSGAYRFEFSQVDRPTISNRAFLLPKGKLFLVGSIAFCVSVGEGAMADWSAVFLREITLASEGAAALGYTVFSATMVITRISGDKIIARFGPVAVVRGSGIVAALGLFIVVYSTVSGVALMGFALVGIGYAVVMPLVFSRAAQDPHMAPGAAVAAVATLGYGGMLLGPALVGLIAHLMGLSFSIFLLGILATCVVLLASCLKLDQSEE